MLDMGDANLTTMIYFAQKTGGKAIYGTNDVAGEIEAAIADTDLTYTLGFYSTEENRTAKPHNLHVEVKRKGVEVRYRESYSGTGLGTPITPTTRTGTINLSMHEPLEFTEIPVFASATPVADRPGYYDVAVKIDISEFKLEERSGRYKGNFELAIAPDIENHQKGLRQTIALTLTQERLLAAMNDGVTVVNRIRATDNKGKLMSKKLHVVVMDNATLKTGSVRVPIQLAK